MSELLPCPFCGSPGEVVESREAFPNMPLHYYPTCTREDINHDCPAAAQPDGETNAVGCAYKTPEEAAAAWNRRHTPDGWQLVPMEPTVQMEISGKGSLSATQFGIRTAYKRMLAAAPRPGGE